MRTGLTSVTCSISGSLIASAMSRWYGQTGLLDPLAQPQARRRDQRAERITDEFF
jgi:hypothetical protein